MSTHKKKDDSLLVWDLPTRLFHWLLVICIIGLFVTGKQSDMERHLPLAYFTLGLIIFRVLWGFVGSYYSKFDALQLSPITTFAYIKNKMHSNYPGHNPLGSWGVVALLVFLSTQLITGLFANDSVMTNGPLSYFISNELSDKLTGIHVFNMNILLGLIGIHIIGVLFHMYIMKEDIFRGMITGKRTGVTMNKTVTVQPLFKALAALIFSLGVVWFIINLNH